MIPVDVQLNMPAVLNELMLNKTQQDSGSSAEGAVRYKPIGDMTESHGIFAGFTEGSE